MDVIVVSSTAAEAFVGGSHSRHEVRSRRLVYATVQDVIDTCDHLQGIGFRCGEVTGVVLGVAHRIQELLAT